MSVFDDPSLQEARSSAQTASKTALDAQTGDLTLADQLREALNKKFSTSNPLMAEREQATQNYLTSSTEAPLRVTPRSAGGMSDVVYSPLQQANLIQQYRAPGIARLGTLNDLLGLQTGGVDNIIGSTSRASQAQTQGLVNTATLAQQQYKNLLEELTSRAAEKKAGASAGGDFSGLLELLLPAILGGNQGSQEEKPFNLPVKPGEALDPGKLYYSPEGNWVFDFDTMDWAPVID